jgi:hypothetical protein
VMTRRTTGRGAAAGEGGVVAAAARIRWTPDAVQAAARAYCAEAELPAATLADAAALLLSPYDLHTLTPSDRADYDALSERVALVWAWAEDRYHRTVRHAGTPTGEALADPTAAEDVLPAHERTALAAAIAAQSYPGPFGGLWGLASLHAPTLTAAWERVEVLQERARLTREALGDYLAPLLARADGTGAPWPDTWATARALPLEDLRDALRRIALADATARADKAEATARRLTSLPLRMGTRALTTHTRQPGRPWADTLKHLKRTKVLTAAELRQLETGEPVPLSGDEILVTAGLLHVASREAGFRAFGPTAARVGNYDVSVRFSIPKPRLEEFCRLLGFTPTGSGTVSGHDRDRVQRALERLSRAAPRPIVVRQQVREGKRWRENYIVTWDIPVQDQGERYALHPTLFDGVLAAGHLVLDRLPSQWDDARRAIGERNLTEDMKQADLHLRWLARGVLYGARRAFLEAWEGPKETAAAAWRTHKPTHVEKTLMTAGLLDRLALTVWREKKGPAAARERLEKALNFAVAVEGNALEAWTWRGGGKLPPRLALTFRVRDDADVTGEDLPHPDLFDALGPGPGGDE